MIYQKTYRRLLTASDRIVRHRQALAKESLSDLIQDVVSPALSNEELLGHLLADALTRRVDRDLLASRNIYVQEFDVPQTELFYSMARAVPFVRQSHVAANRFAASAASGSKHVMILDIGIGRAQQAAHLLELLAELEEPPESVHVTGFDIAAENVSDSRDVIEALAASVPFLLTYSGTVGAIEELSETQWQELLEQRKGALIVNSAFTLHHTKHKLDDGDERTALLARIASLRPDAFTLIEPSSNHDSEELGVRVHNAWLHYGTVFALVDESDIDPTHKHLIKQKFFGREVQDIFGVSDHFRSERHELYESWLLRLHRAGFEPLANPGLVPELPDYCEAIVSDGLVRFNYRDLPIVAVFAVRPGSRSGEAE